MTEEYRLPDGFTQQPVADDDEFDRWTLVRGEYQVCIARYYDAATSYWWVGKASEAVPNIYGGQWTIADSLEQASKAAWSAYRIFADLDRAFGPTQD